jgi:hypothetical protein
MDASQGRERRVIVRPFPRRGRGRHRVALVLAALATAISPASALANHPAPPRKPTQALTDGCQRSDLGIGFGTSPQWVYVYRSPAIRKAKGLVRVAHATVDDSQLQHQSYDFNGNLVPARGFRYLLGGRPSQHTGNFSGNDEETRRLHFEWESGALPFFVWPTDGDRAAIWGSWIWDCGHWTNVENNVNGAVTGEHTEFHPLNAIVVNRRAPYGPAKNASETDAFISNRGTRAHAVEKCALKHHPQGGAPFPQYDAGFRPCYQRPANQVQPLKKTYRFFVPAPPKPHHAARLRYRARSRIGGGSGTERIKARRRGLEVTVKRSGKTPIRYGKSFYVWWSHDTRKRPTALKVRLKSIKVNQSDPEPIYGAASSPWELYLDLNGSWTLLNRWAPGLSSVSDGERVAIDHTVRIHVPRRAGVWLQLSGMECDEPTGTTLFGVTVGLVHPCPANPTEVNPNIFNLLKNDGTGIVLDRYRSAKAALGSHSSKSVAETRRFPHSPPINLGHGTEGQGAYVLKYSVRPG